MRLLILAAAERMPETVHRARIAPFHRGIGHAGDWLPEVKGRARDDEHAAEEYHQRFGTDIALDPSTVQADAEGCQGEDPGECAAA